MVPSSSSFATDYGRNGDLYTFERPKTQKETFIRGSLFAAVPGFIQRYLGADGWNDFLKRVDPLAGSVMQAGFVALAWYPFRVVTSTVEALQESGKLLGKKNAIKDMATCNLDHATRGILRAIFKIGSPEFMLGRSDMVWTKFYSTGVMKIHTGRGEAVVQLRWVPDITTLYTMTIMYTLEAVIAKAGGRVTLAETTKDAAVGDEYCEYHYRWM